MSELQPGMLALVVGSLSHPENIGRIIKIGDRAPYRWTEIFGDGFLTDDLPGSKWALSKNLLPIKPEADPLDVTHKEELHA